MLHCAELLPFSVSTGAPTMNRDAPKFLWRHSVTVPGIQITENLPTILRKVIEHYISEDTLVISLTK